MPLCAERGPPRRQTIPPARGGGSQAVAQSRTAWALTQWWEARTGRAPRLTSLQVDRVHAAVGSHGIRRRTVRLRVVALPADLAAKVPKANAYVVPGIVVLTGARISVVDAVRDHGHGRAVALGDD